MKRYDSYKPSGVSWIPEVPSHWELKQLRAYLKLISYKGHGNKQLLSVTREQGVIIRNVDSKVENHNYIPDDLSGYKLIRPGQFAVNKMKSWQGSYGVSKYEGIVSPAYYVCDLNFPCKEFFSMAIRSKAYIPFFSQMSKGIRVDQWDLSTIALKSIYFAEPPLDEQEAIVSFLYSKTSKIDSYVAERERELDALEELRQAEVARVVTQGLNPDVPMRDSGITWLGKIPAHWEIRKMKFSFKERSEKNHPDELKLSATQSHGVIPQTMYEDKGNHVVDVNKNFEGLKLVKVGDFVIHLRSFQGGLAFAHYQGIISAAYTILTPIEPEFAQFYKFLFTSHPYIQLLKTCVTGIREGQNIDYGVLGNQFIPIPPLEEQRAIVDYINSKTSKIDGLIADLSAQIEKLKEYKQRLIADVVTGQIDVRK